MLIKPMYKGYICITAHPDGCANNVIDQINYIKSQPSIEAGPKNVLVVGASTGYGLASRIASTYGAGSKTIGIMFEKPASNNRTATAGWYNTAAFERYATEEGYYAKSINGDAFSTEVKDETIQLIKKDMGQIDLLIYSVASPRRTDPNTGETYTSTLKPISETFSGKTVDFNTHVISKIDITPASEKEIEQTVKVMGGEDWLLWIEALKESNLLAPNFNTVAYTYVGSEITKPIYRNGTIGKAKEHLEKTASNINQLLQDLSGKAYVSSNKALVTQSSSAIPVVPLYISALTKIMKEKNIEEGCIEQIYRMFQQKLFVERPIIDTHGLIRLDEYELRPDVQEEVVEIWNQLNTENVKELTDIIGFHYDFLKLFGFGHPRVDYNIPTEPNVEIPNMLSV